MHLITDSPQKKLRQTDALLTFRLDQPGPNATLPTLSPNLPFATVAEEILGFIHAVPPKGAIPLKIKPSLPSLKLWKYGGKICLRTTHSLIWPAWTQVVEGEDVHLYVLPLTQSLVVSFNGHYTKIQVEGALN